MKLSVRRVCMPHTNCYAQLKGIFLNVFILPQRRQRQQSKQKHASAAVARNIKAARALLDIKAGMFPFPEEVGFMASEIMW